MGVEVLVVALYVLPLGEGEQGPDEEEGDYLENGE